MYGLWKCLRVKTGHLALIILKRRSRGNMNFKRTLFWFFNSREKKWNRPGRIKSPNSALSFNQPFNSLRIWNSGLAFPVHFTHNLSLGWNLSFSQAKAKVAVVSPLHSGCEDTGCYCTRTREACTAAEKRAPSQAETHLSPVGFLSF